MRWNKAFLVVLLVITVTCTITGCGDKSFKNDTWDLPGGADQTSYTYETTDKPSATVVPNDIENSPTTDSNPGEPLNTADPYLIEIRIANKDVYVNGHIVDYPKNDMGALETSLRGSLSNLSDDMHIVLDNEYGDDVLCSVVDGVIYHLGISVSLRETDD